jgi:hypothetical protein
MQDFQITEVLRGADPEVFLRTDDEYEDPVVSIGLIGGTKSEPRSLGNGYALQEDNVTVEFNIPPASNVTQFKASIQYVLGFLKQELSPKNIKLDIVPTMDFPEHMLMHPQAQELGCEPDYNAWTCQVNPRPVAPETLRSSGGHLHIGYANPNVETSRKIVKAHDLFLGVASVIYDSDTRRREIYGKAGAHRIKPYGVEYRTLSNFWIKSEELMQWAYEQSEKAIQFVNDGGEINGKWAKAIQKCINTGDKELLGLIDTKFHVL